MPPFLGFGRRRCLGLAVFVLLVLGLSWNVSKSGGDDVEEEDFAEEYTTKPFIFNSSLSSNLYNQFLSPLPPPRRSHLRIQPVPLLPQPCLSEWLTHGTLLDPSCSRVEQPRLDFVWTWLNSSDPLWLHQFNSYRGRQSIPARHYRDHGELQHSLRSVEDALSSSLDETRRGSFFVVSGDWESERDSGGRVGQRPSWLALPSERGEGGRVLREVSHSDIFAAGGGRELRKKFEKRMEESLPSFNSFSIESHLYDIPSLSPTYVYLNDDFFLLTPHTSSSFHSLPFGPVIPFSFSSPTFKTPFNPNPNPEERRFWNIEPGFVGSSNKGSFSGGDESMALERSNYLIGERFGHRPRPTLLHAPKPLLSPIQHELNLIWWEKHFSKSTRRRFREDGKTKPGDYHSVWLGETFLVERAREAMLWSWIVVMMGEEGRKGRWEERERDVVRELLGLPPTVKITDPKRPSSSDRSLLGIFFNGANTLNSLKSPVVTVNQTTLEKRHTLRPENVRRTFEALGEEGPKGNAIGWTSLDGPAPPFGASSSSCSIDLRACFGDFWPDNARQCINEEASNIFKRLAFERPQCGDCLLSALIQASGPLGTSKLLPAQSSTFVANFPVDPPSSSPFEEEPQPHLPLTESWKKTDFSLRAVLGGGVWGAEVELKDWCERLIARYTASSTKDSTSLFARLRTPLEFKSTLKLLETMEPKVGMVAMNDDLPDSTAGEGKNGGREDEGEETVRLLQQWIEGKWSGKGGWED
ncbi:hypothetical protein BDY24DRAFT_443052 [Mrakia frigida]|uniref:uncharacterized protein n=1 Tax=Mrakia frigida TaxID=29902 RepID=UPI003FCC1579